MPCIALSTFSRKLRHNICVLLFLLSRSSLSVSIERYEVQFPSGSPKRGQMRRGSGCLWVECMLRETPEQGLPALSWMVRVMHTWKSSLKPLRKLTEQYAHMLLSRGNNIYWSARCCGIDITTMHNHRAKI